MHHIALADIADKNNSTAPCPSTTPLLPLSPAPVENVQWYLHLKQGAADIY